jgi:hypothetical protein
MKANAHTRAIEEITLEAIVVKLDQLLKLTEDYVTPLTAQERHDLPRLGRIQSRLFRRPRPLSFREQSRPAI